MAKATHGELMRRLAHRMQRLQEELALESVSNIELEEASRRSFDYLTGQLTVLKEAFNKLTDCMVEELEMVGKRLDQKVEEVSASFMAGLEDSELATAQEELKSAHNRLQNAFDAAQEKAEMELREAEAKAAQLGGDLDAVLQVIPKLEDKIDAVSRDVARLNDSASQRFEEVSSRIAEAGSDRRLTVATSRLEGELRKLESDLREEMEQRHLKLQRNITRQLDGISKATAEPVSPTSERAAMNRRASIPAGMHYATADTNPSPAISPHVHATRRASTMSARPEPQEVNTSPASALRRGSVYDVPSAANMQEAGTSPMSDVRDQYKRRASIASAVSMQSAPRSSIAPQEDAASTSPDTMSRSAMRRASVPAHMQEQNVSPAMSHNASRRASMPAMAPPESPAYSAGRGGASPATRSSLRNIRLQ